MPDAPGPETHLVGKHAVTLEGDIIHLDYAGDYSGDEAVEITRLCSEVTRRHPRSYILCNTANAGTVSPEARQVWIAWFGDHNVEAIVCYGAGSFTTRTLIKMVAASARVLLGIEPHFVFTSTEADARAWIHQHRGRAS